MELYDLTLKKEVARECAWGIMGTISRNRIFKDSSKENRIRN